MAVEAEVADGAGNGAKKGGKKLIIMIAAAVVVVLAGGAGAYFMMSGSSGGAGDHAAGEAVPPPVSFIFNLPTMTVNLNAEEGQESFMQLSVALEVADQAMMAEIQPRMAKVIDAFQVYLRELRKSDLAGSAGIYRLKEELLRRVNVAIHPAVIDSILFKEILVQ